MGIQECNTRAIFSVAGGCILSRLDGSQESGGVRRTLLEIKDDKLMVFQDCKRSSWLVAIHHKG
jgi:hypothetical protein